MLEPGRAVFGPGPRRLRIPVWWREDQRRSFDFVQMAIDPNTRSPQDAGAPTTKRPLPSSGQPPLFRPVRTPVGPKTNRNSQTCERVLDTRHRHVASGPEAKEMADGGLRMERLASGGILACAQKILPGILKSLVCRSRGEPEVTGGKATQSHHKAIY
jgi:hypothetical protein